MLDIFRNGIFILYSYKEAVLFFCIAVLGLGVFSIKQITNKTTESEVSLMAACGLGSIVLCLSSYGLMILSHFLPFLLLPGSYAILIFGLFTLIRSLYRGEIKVLRLLTLVGGVAFFLLLCIRLAFLKSIILPPYSDSPVHYQIVSGFLHPNVTIGTKLSLNSILTNYYHFGFHSMATWLASIANMEPANAISLLGQLFLIIGPLSVIFLTKTLTGSDQGAWFAGLLSAIGWHMPAFAVNWGKYPALTSLATLPATLAFLWLFSQGNITKKKGVLWGSILIVSIVLLHTRMIICILLFMSCHFLTVKLLFDSKIGYLKSIIYSALYLVVLWSFVPILNDFYNGFIVAILMLVLVPFAFQTYPYLTTEIFLLTFGIWLLSTAPTLLNKDYPVLFDRQFVAMMLYIPFSILGGLGLAGIIKQNSLTEIYRGALVTVLFGVIIINFWKNDSIYPNPCCNYYQASDQLAFDWLQQHISKHALVIISAFDNDGQLVGTDAGIWLTPLLSQPTNKLSFDFKWDSPDEIEKLCHLNTNAVFIYMGGRAFSFDNAQLSLGKWTQAVYKTDKTAIYKISNCP